jgi:predicted membrane channel-forming protein YqfA (hemolysin III family)
MKKKNCCPHATVVKSFSKTPAIIINIKLVTLFTLFLVHICWHRRQVDKKTEKKLQKKIATFP